VLSDKKRRLSLKHDDIKLFFIEKLRPIKERKTNETNKTLITDCTTVGKDPNKQLVT